MANRSKANKYSIQNSIFVLNDNNLFNTILLNRSDTGAL